MIIPEKPLTNDLQSERSLSERKVGLLKELPYHISDISGGRPAPPRHPSLSQSTPASSSPRTLRSSSRPDLKRPQCAVTHAQPIFPQQRHHQRSIPDSLSPLSGVRFNFS